ncbi:hypothetical protein DOTSEDRAFT_130789 [Dothistroma septosporum NZE10]|uniref:NmrA-like domain-containing protein n=1 Tax=Dothistroma septosporum (strain NZE10 / CBS 128990) TaxID=675120 RepID=N1PNH1_DOTSN|nr:hypothetical protein DOTSEDRAFT_130789 [Dothistroma septosporum NZE10]
MSTLAIAGASGKLGFATLTALLDHNLIPSTSIICTTSSTSGYENLSQITGVSIRHASWDDESSWETALQGCNKLLLISSARIDKDFAEAPPGQGREADHYNALRAASKVGVEHVYYTSLAFAIPSLSRVAVAHERTEDYLHQHWNGKLTVLREGLYNESWPLYLGHYDVPNDDRKDIVVAGDGKISWTSIAVLGLATALILAADGKEWDGRTVYLSQRQAYTLAEVAEMMSRVKGREVRVKVVERDEHEKYYVQERGMDELLIEWWSKTYDALRKNECEIHDPTLEDLLAAKGVKPNAMEETVREMLSG